MIKRIFALGMTLAMLALFLTSCGLVADKTLSSKSDIFTAESLTISLKSNGSDIEYKMDNKNMTIEVLYKSDDETATYYLYEKDGSYYLAMVMSDSTVDKYEISRDLFISSFTNASEYITKLRAYASTLDVWDKTGKNEYTLKDSEGSVTMKTVLVMERDYVLLKNNADSNGEIEIKFYNINKSTVKIPNNVHNASAKSF